MGRWLDVRKGPAPESIRGPASRAEPNDGRSAPPISGLRRNDGDGPFASAAADRLAKELGVSLESVKGTGAGGMITVPDVRAAHSEAIDQES